MEYNKDNSDTRVRPVIKSPRDIQKQIKASKEATVYTEDEVASEFEAIQAELDKVNKELAKKESIIKALKAEQTSTKEVKSSKNKSD